jgi:CubicO group peptidase (beta-lactamase class C family)
MKALLLAALVLGAEPAPAPEPFAEETRRALEDVVRAELARGPHGGLSVGVRSAGQRWVEGFGLRDVARRKPATPGTTYRLASITKSFTAVAVLQLEQQGKLALDEDVHTLVPAFAPQAWPVTVRQLLGHLGGVSHYDGPESSENVRHLDTAGALALFAYKPLVAEPGTRFVYSSWGYNLLGAAVEKASGEPYGDYLRAHVFGPAGMSTAALDDTRTRDAQHAVGYRLSQGRLVPSHYLDVSSRFAGGGTRGSVEDLLAFGEAMLHDRLVPAATRQRMCTSMSTRAGALTDYGMGFATYPLRGHAVVAHAGGQPETTTLLLMLPSEDLVLALATNLEGDARRLRRLSQRLIETLREEGQVHREAAFADPVDAVVHEGLARLFTYGLAFRDGPGEAPAPGDPPEFTQVSELLDRTRIALDVPGALERVRAAHQPRAGSLFIRVGLSMARTLERVHGHDKLQEYPRRGPLAFFADYVAACEQEACAEPLRFGQALRQDVARFDEAWRRSQVPALARARLDEVTRPESLWPALEASARDYPHPDYVEELLRVAALQARLGRPEEQRRWLERAVALHPRSDEARQALAKARGQPSARPPVPVAGPVPDDAGRIRAPRVVNTP